MSHSYLDAVYQGKNDWWRYLLGVMTIVFCGFFCGSLAVAIVGIAFLLLTQPHPVMLQDPTQLNQALKQLLDSSSLSNFVLQNLPFVALILGIFLAVKLIHGRSVRSLISPSSTI